jgi:undecaprenyl pyrophosphate phosphatase UppP
MLSARGTANTSGKDGGKFMENIAVVGNIIIAVIVTILVGFVSSSIFASWINAPELGVVVAIATMGAFILWATYHPKNK